MAGVEIRLEGEAATLSALAQAHDALEYPLGMYEAIGAAMVESTKQRFDNGEDPAGNPWPVSLRAQFEGGKTLVDSAALKQSITHIADQNGVEIGTNLHYAAIVSEQEAGRVKSELVAKNNALAASMVNVGRKSRISGHQIQNLGFQVGDFGTQVAAGTSASIALAQQLPQLLGGFGVAGAVIGGVVAIGAALIRVFSDTGDAAESATNPLDDLTASVDAYRAAAGDAASGTDDLIATYGTASEAVRELLDLQEQLSLRQAKSDLAAAINSLSDNGAIGKALTTIQLVKDAIQQINDQGGTVTDGGAAVFAAGIEKTYAKLGETLGITTKQAKDLIDALEATSTAGTAEEQLTRLSAIREGYLGLVGDVADLTDEQAAFLQEIKNAELEAQKLVATSGGIAAGIDAAVTSADKLTAALKNANAESFLYSQRFAGEDALMNMPLTVDPHNRPPNDPPSHGTGGASTSAAEKHAAAIKKITDGLQKEIDQLGELDPVEQEMIRLRGQLGDATASETEMVRHLIEVRNEEREQLDENIAKLDFMRDSFRSFLDIFRRDGDSSLTFLEKLWGSLDKIGSKLTDLALNNLSDVLFGEKGSSSGGGIGNFLGKLLGGIKFNAMGDVFDGPTLFGYGSGQLGILGEAGKEGIMPLSRKSRRRCFARSGRWSRRSRRWLSAPMLASLVLTPSSNRKMLTVRPSRKTAMCFWVPRILGPAWTN